MAGVELTADEQEFLLSIIDNPDSDYDDMLDGWPNFHISPTGELHVKFKTSEEIGTDRRVLEGTWRLTYIGGSAQPQGKD